MVPAPRIPPPLPPACGFVGASVPDAVLPLVMVSPEKLVVTLFAVKIRKSGVPIAELRLIVRRLDPGPTIVRLLAMFGSAVFSVIVESRCEIERNCVGATKIVSLLNGCPQRASTRAIVADAVGQIAVRAISVELTVKVVAALATGSRCLRTFAFARKRIKRETRQRADVTATKRFARGLRGMFSTFFFYLVKTQNAAEK
jgi:hypothetical protein